jgi:hypothetical protein
MLRKYTLRFGGLLARHFDKLTYWCQCFRIKSGKKRGKATERVNHRMAQPIKDTPILRGKESDKFLEAVAKRESERVSTERYAKSKEAYHKIVAKLK